LAFENFCFAEKPPSWLKPVLFRKISSPCDIAAALANCRSMLLLLPERRVKEAYLSHHRITAYSSLLLAYS